MPISGNENDDALLIARARAAYGAGQHTLAARLAGEVPAGRAASLDALEVMALAQRALGDVAETERLLRRAIAVAPARHWPRDDLARLLLDTGRADVAEQVCREAVDADAANANAQAMLGNFLSEREELVEGACHLRNALALAGPHPQLQANLGHNLARQGRLAEAETLLRQSLAAVPDALSTLAWLAEILEQDRRFDEASTMLDAAEMVAAKQGTDVKLQRATLLSRTTEWRRGLTLLEGEKLLSGAARLQRGRLRDRAGRHDDAWQDFVAGKAALARASGRDYPDAAVARLVADLVAFFTPANLSTILPAPVAAGVPQPIFVLGFPRSGTTLTEQVIASHSRIRAGGELPFAAELSVIAVERSGGAYPGDFTALFRPLHASLATTLRDHYLARAKAFGLLAPGADFFTDKMPLNELYLPLLRLAFPAAPLVSVTRHPLDVMVSAMSHDFTHGFDCGYRLEDAARHFAAMNDLTAHWRDGLAMHSHALGYERFVAAQETETAALMKHLGLAMEPAQLAFHQSRRFAPTPSYAQVQEPLHDRSIGRWRPYAGALAPARAILAEAIARGGYAG
ncbi:MAG: sulfotransferase [Sphingomonas bacterium]|uniref:tetratricopeptide repeat-containing sulfotransferase family protein n=1 Tax=Sphingomonas bacterium TaxID=1895847 RepID=UPI002629700F|nr:sulfotransferase [Sphingomonas bacterium]MDB5712325.1 sulfotransferase [Sphingomonas bacterium]